MNGKIAIEPNLTTFKSYLTEKGYNVESIKLNESSNNLEDFDAIVVTGLNKNIMGIQDTATKAVVINADGLTPEELAQELDYRK